MFGPAAISNPRGNWDETFFAPEKKMVSEKEWLNQGKMSKYTVPFKRCKFGTVRDNESKSKYTFVLIRRLNVTCRCDMMRGQSVENIEKSLDTQRVETGFFFRKPVCLCSFRGVALDR